MLVDEGTDDYNYLFEDYGSENHKECINPESANFASEEILKQTARYRLPVIRAFINWHCFEYHTNKVKITKLEKYIQKTGVSGKGSLKDYKHQLDDTYEDLSFNRGSVEHEYW